MDLLLLKMYLLSEIKTYLFIYLFGVQTNINTFQKNYIKFAIKHLICECYFTIGNSVFFQIIGIPMGIDPASFWANLYLYQFENQFMKDLRKSDFVTATRFHYV